MSLQGTSCGPRFNWEYLKLGTTFRPERSINFQRSNVWPFADYMIARTISYDAISTMTVDISLETREHICLFNSISIASNDCNLRDRLTYLKMHIEVQYISNFNASPCPPLKFFQFLQVFPSLVQVCNEQAKSRFRLVIATFLRILLLIPTRYIRRRITNNTSLVWFSEECQLQWWFTRPEQRCHLTKSDIPYEITVSGGVCEG